MIYIYVSRYLRDFSFTMAVVVKSTTNKTGTIPVMFKVYLPNREGFVSVAYNKETQLQQVLETVCMKRDLKTVRKQGISQYARSSIEIFLNFLGRLHI